MKLDPDLKKYRDQRRVGVNLCATYRRTGARLCLKDQQLQLSDLRAEAERTRSAVRQRQEDDHVHTVETLKEYAR